MLFVFNLLQNSHPLPADIITFAVEIILSFFIHFSVTIWVHWVLNIFVIVLLILDSLILLSPKSRSISSKNHLVSAVNFISVGNVHHNLFTDIWIPLLFDSLPQTTTVVVAFALLFIQVALAWTLYIPFFKKVLLTFFPKAWFQSPKSRSISPITFPLVIASKFTVTGAVEGVKFVFMYIHKLLWFSVQASHIHLLSVSFWSGFFTNKQLSIHLSRFDTTTFHKSSTIPIGFGIPSQSMSGSHTSQIPFPSVSFWLGL